MQIVNVHVEVVIIFCAPAVQIPRLKLFAENNYVFTVCTACSLSFLCQTTSFFLVKYLKS